MFKHDDDVDTIDYITTIVASLAIGALIVCIMIVETLTHDEHPHESTRSHDDK